MRKARIRKEKEEGHPLAQRAPPCIPISLPSLSPPSPPPRCSLAIACLGASWQAAVGPSIARWVDVPHHLLTLWNPSYAADAMDVHLRVLLDWAGRWRRGEAPGELEHMPDYYRGQFADFWFRLWDIRGLVADDMPAVMEELKGETERMAQEHRPDDLDQTPRHDPAKPGPILEDDFGQSRGDEPAQSPRSRPGRARSDPPAPRFSPSSPSASRLPAQSHL